MEGNDAQLLASMGYILGSQHGSITLAAVADYGTFTSSEDKDNETRTGFDNDDRQHGGLGRG